MRKILTSCLALLLLSSPTAAQTLADVDGYTLRAAYLANVVRYVTWPDETARDELVIGILGGSGGVYEALQSTPIPRVRGHDIKVRQLSRTSQLNSLDVLYIAPGGGRYLDAAFSASRRHPILVITEHTPIREEMMINLISSSQNQLAFQVNNERIRAAGLTPSNDLLMLRGNELEIMVAYRQLQEEYSQLQDDLQNLTAELTMLERENNQLQGRIDILEQTITEREQALQAQQGTLEDKQLLMESQQSALNELLAELEEQRTLLLERERELEAIQDDLVSSEHELAEQQALLEQREEQLEEKQREGDELAERIAANRDVLSAQQQQLRDQREALEEQTELLESRKATIDRQRLYLYFIGIGFAIAMVLGIVAIIFYINKRRANAELQATVTSLHEAQDKLIESEKMAALGGLVAGVAHEVNTPLGVAITAASMLDDRRRLLAEQVADGKLTKEELERFLEQSSESLELTEKNLKRVAQLITNFKQVAVDQMVSEQREIDLRNYLEEIFSTLSIELRKAGVTYELDVPENIKLTTIPGAMAQIITNLVTNAIRHAFGNGEGTITVKAETAEGNRVRIYFSDNGCGMSEDIQARIFDPFYTTQRHNGGTGLGMPIVYNLVNGKLQGEINVHSTEGQGTTFTLLLPRNL